MKRILIALAVAALLLTAVLPVSAEEGTFSATRAVRISDTEVVVEFDKALDYSGIEGAFTALRWEKMEDGTPAGLAWEGGSEGAGAPLQVAISSWNFWSDFDMARIVLTFDAEALNSYAETEGNQWYDMGYRAFLVMEEKSPAAGHAHMILDTVFAADGSMMTANILNPAAAWDGAALAIEVDYDYSREGFGETEEVTFAPPVTVPEETEGDATSAPAATNEPDGTGAAVTEETPAEETPAEDKGCGGAIAMAPVSLVMVLGTALIASKKR